MRPMFVDVISVGSSQEKLQEVVKLIWQALWLVLSVLLSQSVVGSGPNRDGRVWANHRSHESFPRSHG